MADAHFQKQVASEGGNDGRKVGQVQVMPGIDAKAGVSGSAGGVDKLPQGLFELKRFSLAAGESVVQVVRVDRLRVEGLLSAAQYSPEQIAGRPVIVEVPLEAVRRKRTMSPLLRDEDLDLTINELMRIRERPAALKVVQGFKGTKVRAFKKPKAKPRKL